MEEGVGTPSTYPLLQHRSTKRSFSSMAETYQSSSPDSLFVPLDDRYDHNQTSQRTRLDISAIPQRHRPTRIAGVGYDLRTPVMSAGGGAERTVNREPVAVIDLTEDIDLHEGDYQAGPSHVTAAMGSHTRVQRPPRFGRNIIDVESEEENDSFDPAMAPSDSGNLPSSNSHHNSSSELQHPQFSILRRPQRSRPSNTTMSSDTDDLLFVEQRPRSRLQTVSRAHTPSVPAQRSVTPYPAGLGDTIDLTGEDDDVVHVESRTRPRTNLEGPTTTGGVGTRSIVDRLPTLGNFEIGNRLLHRLGWDFRAQQTALDDLAHRYLGNTNTETNRNQRHPIEPHSQSATYPAHFGNIQHMLGYGTVAFDLGLPGGNRPPTPKYEAPEAANSGFTRSPSDNEIVVCPNCGDELAIGETEEKQEIWVIKRCGHAYCGVCAHKRAKSSRGTRKGKGKGKAPESPSSGPPTFKTCVVDGCKEPAAANSMVHVFLSS